MDQRFNPRTTLEYIGDHPSRLTREGRTKFAQRANFAHLRRLQTTRAGEANLKINVLLDSIVVVSVGFRHLGFEIFHASLRFYDKIAVQLV